MNDTIPALWVALIFTAILILTRILDVRERRRMANDAALGAMLLAEHAVSMASSGECAKPWVTGERDGYHVHLCARPYEHTGPCDCGVCPDGLDR